MCISLTQSIKINDISVAMKFSSTLRYSLNYIKTHNSESQGQEEAQQRDH